MQQSKAIQLQSFDNTPCVMCNIPAFFFSSFNFANSMHWHGSIRLFSVYGFNECYSITIFFFIFLASSHNFTTFRRSIVKLDKNVIYNSFFIVFIYCYCYRCSLSPVSSFFFCLFRSIQFECW